MEVQVLKENLVKYLQTAIKFTSNRSQLPILSHVLVEAEENGIFITATNLEMGFRARVPGKVLKAGKVVAPAKLLVDLVQYLPLGGVELKVDEGVLRVVGGKVKAKVQVGQVEDFPPFPEWGRKDGQIKVKELSKAYEKVGYAVSQDDSRPILTGFLWQIKQGALVATDGYRLSMVEGFKAWETTIKEDQVIVAGRSMVQVLQSLGEYEVAECDFYYDEKMQQIIFGAKDILITARVLVGDYPQYEAILPKKGLFKLEIDREEFLEAVRAVAIFARDSANIIKIKASKEEISVSANSAQVGENLVELEGKVEGEGEIVIAFNSKYLVDFLTHSEALRVGIEMSDSLKPGLFYESTSKDFKHVIMPVRVRETN